MSKRDLRWNEAKYKRWIKEKRGQGSGADYIPFLKIQDLPSLGRVSRGPGWKTNRLHHLFSDLETHFLYCLEWSDHVIDIREQFPMDIELTMRIAGKLGIDYPCDKTSGAPYVLTTDFLVTYLENRRESMVAYQVKPASKLEDPAVLQRLEVERRHWKEKEIPWFLVTDRDIPKVIAQNVEWIHEHYWLTATEEMSINDLLEMGERLKEKLSKSHDSINVVTNDLDREFNVTNGTSNKVFSYLLARKEISMDMNTKIHLGLPASAITHIYFRERRTITWGA
ncbi:Transposon Tn7 transposition protein TnsA [bioreactor metagenome]|uniref:Transposon Tn7 transposition protein TnsA n=1 Tax=bioreactor metagenome TaxID=1076179 RepID=A0A644W7U9_9ZZZZ|nr:TnsA endonuclease N-terminal domain-containing protein [Desulfitobacterium hafniense]MEA5025897.1 TnsA endonuclease C-terminal domain-containing protein [Desulfitobacterium hafniense]